MDRHTNVLMDQASTLIAELRSERDQARQQAADYKALYLAALRTIGAKDDATNSLHNGGTEGSD